MGNTTINLTLTLDQVNGILNALGNMPFVQVAGLIQEVQGQAAPQVPQPAAAPQAVVIDN